MASTHSPRQNESHANTSTKPPGNRTQTAPRSALSRTKTRIRPQDAAHDCSSNMALPCNIHEKSANDNKDAATQCHICQAPIHSKCNQLNYIDHKYLQWSRDP